jgi:protein-S-isoprenylcysteine O-methyltransferase Ste14
VVTGLHRYVRNPMYLGVLLALLGELLLFPSWQFLWYIAFFFILVNSCWRFVLAYEEPVLKRSFGEEYDHYRRIVPRWIPRWRAHDLTAS